MVERIGNEEGIDFGTRGEAAEPILVAQANTGTTGQPAPTTAETRIVVELEDDVILRLPATASVDQPRTSGADLEFVQADGSVIVVPNGAIQGLTIFIGATEIPPLTVAALFEANGIEAAAGPAGAGAGARGSGGNFEVPVGGIGDAFNLGDLLDPTELAFTTPENEEFLAALEDDEPTIGLNGTVFLDDDWVSGGSQPLLLRAFTEEGEGNNVVSGRLAFDYGRDGEGSVVLSGATFPTALGLSFVVEDGGRVLIIMQGETAVVRVELTDTTSGRFTVTQLAPMTHPDGSTEDDIAFGVNFIVRDSDGDGVLGTLPIVVNDSVPRGAWGSESITVAEDDILTRHSIGTSPNDGREDGSITGDPGELKGPATATGSLEAIVNFGADGAAANGGFSLDAGKFDTLIDQGLTSKSINLAYSLSEDGSTLIATAGPDGHTVFTLTLEGNGDFTFRLFDQLDHFSSEARPDGDTTLAIDFGGVIKITDSDGDSTHLDGAVIINVTDDLPVAFLKLTGNTVTHDETAGYQADDVYGFSLIRAPFSALEGDGIKAIGYAADLLPVVLPGYHVGADGAGSADLSLKLVEGAEYLLTTTSGGEITLYEQDGLIVGRVGGPEGQVAFAVSLSETGHVTIAQYLPLSHPDDGDHNDVISLNGIVKAVLTVTDADNDPVVREADIGSAIRFRDDGPVLTSFKIQKNALVVHDETPGAQSDTDSSVDHSALFSGFIAGNDPQVPGAIGYASIGGGNLFNIVEKFGADGKWDTTGRTFTLELGNAATNLTTSEGHAISLERLSNGIVIGKVLTGASAGEAAFAIHIDQATGNVTLAQYLSLQHPTGGLSHDEAVYLTGENLKVKLTLTDGDGDTTSKTIDLGQAIGFQDDGPNVIVSATSNSTVTHDESPGPQNAIWNWFGPSGDSNDDDVGIIASIAVSGLFSGVTNNGDDPDVSDLEKLLFHGAIGYAQSDKPLVSYTANFGADGAAATGSVKYALELGGQPSGLKTTEGDDIVLKLVSGVIIGEVVSGPFEGKAAFALHVDQQTGKVTMAQWLSLEHGSNPAQHDDAISLAQGSVSVKVIVEDRDGDTHSHSADVSSQIRFEDDGPALDKFRANANGRIVHDETPGLQGSDTSADVSGLFVGLGTAMGHATVAGTSLFSISASFGSDGKQGDTGYTFKLSVGQSTTNLKTVDGDSIDLFVEGDLIVGRVGGQSGEAAFAIHIDAATGNVTLAQYLPLKHAAGDHDDVRFLTANNVKVTLTVTDGDGDTVTSKAVSIGDKIGFRDDGPDAVVDESVALPVLTVDESNGSGSGQDGKLVASASFADNFGTVVDYGADGAGSVGYTLQLVGTNVRSGLYAVDPSAPDGKGAEIVLNQSGGVVTGSLGVVTYFTVTVDASGEVTFTLTGNAPVWHANTGNHDDASTLNVGANKLLLTQTITDGDNDKDSASIDIGSTGVFKIEDDGPALTVVPANGLSNGLFFTGFTSNSPEWGEGSGYTSGTAGAWEITSSTNGGSGSRELQRVGDGYRGADSPTNSVMVDMEASPGNVAISQQITGLASGETYRLSFEIGAANDPSIANTAKLEVFWNGVSVGTYNPASGVMQTQVLNLVAQAGSNTLTFQEIGTSGDNTGTFLANVQINDLIIIDESADIQPDSDEVGGAGVEALFAGLSIGTDQDMQPQYAQGTGAIVASTVNYGTDGQGAALAYGFNITAGATTLKTTEGQVISLALDGGRVVGVYDDGGVSKVAFALHVNGSTGVVTVAQFVSLEHPTQGASHDEGIHLPAGSVRVSVTATDGDDDTATASTDITGLIRFEDDGPQAGTATFTALGAELIKNGGFEDGHNLGSGSNWNLFNEIDHWTKSGNIPFEVQIRNAGGTGNNSAVVELDGDTESQGGAAPSAEGTNASIQQLVEHLVAGQTYQLSFDYAPRTNGGTNTAGLEVWFGGEKVFPVGNTAYPANQWTKVTITVTAGDDQAYLKFVGTGHQDEFGALIDNVSLKASYGGLDDDSQLHGIPGGTDDDADGKILVGNLNIDAGADGLKAIAFDSAATAPFKAIWLDEAGVGHKMDVKLVWEADADGGGVLRGTMTVGGQPVPVLTLTVAQDGSFTLEMHAPLAHAEPGDVPNHENDLQLNLGYTVTDGDGDTDRGTLSVTVDDDTPAAVAGSVTGTVKEADIAEEAGEPVWNTFDFSGGVENQPAVFPAGSGLVANGTTLSNGHFGTVFGLNGQPIVISATDSNSPFQFGGVKVGVAGPNKPMVVEVAGYDDQGNLVAKVSVTVPGPTPNGVPLTTLISSPNLLDGKAIVRLEIKSLEPGSFVQIDDLKIGHGGSAGKVVPAEVELDLSTLANFGADGAHADGGFQIRDLSKTAFGTNTSEGDQVFVEAVDGLLTGYTEDNAKLFTLEIVDGKAVFKLYGEFDHSSQSNVLNLDFGRFITAVDGDGDGALLNSGAVIIKIEDVNRVPTAGEASASVDDDGLEGGNPAPAAGDIIVAHPVGATEATFAGVLPGAGGDGALTFSFVNMDGKPGTIGSEGVKYNWDAASNTLTAEITSGARSGQDLFEVVLDPATGAYTLTLLKPVVHTADGNTEASVFGEISYTVGDSDADTSATDTATGKLTIAFNDDVPTAVDDSASISEDATAAITGNVLTNDIGADGGKIVTTTGLFSGTYGDLQLNPNGGYTYTLKTDAETKALLQGLASGQTQQESFTYTMRDADGDVSQAQVVVTIEGASDGPTGGGSVSLTLSEAALDMQKGGLDLVAGSATGTNSTSPNETQQATSGISFTSTGEAITVGFAAPGGSTWVAPTVTGLAANYTMSWALVGSQLHGTLLFNGASQGVAIRLALSGQTSAGAGGTATPTVTATLVGPLEHSAETVTINGIVVAASSSGGTATGTVNLTVSDDTPIALSPEDAVLSNKDGAPKVFDLDFDNNVTNNYGADGAGNVRFSASLNGDSGLTSLGNPITYAVSGSGLVLTATAGNQTVFTVTLNPASGTYTVDMNGKVDSAATPVSFFSDEYDHTGGNDPWLGLVSDSTTNDVLVTPVNEASPSGTVNYSSNALGTDDVWINDQEAVRLDFVTNLTGDPDKNVSQNDYSRVLNRDHQFDGHYSVNGASVKLNSNGTSKVKFSASDDADGNTIVGDGTARDITSVIIAYGTASLTINSGTTSASIGGKTFTFDWSGNDVVIGGVTGSTTVSIFTATGYDSLLVTHAGDSKFQIKDLAASVPGDDPLHLNLPIEIVDGDGDVASSSIDLALTPASESVRDYSSADECVEVDASDSKPHIIGSNYGDELDGNGKDNVLSGGGGNDILTGDDGDDILLGGYGNDTLEGGEDNDTLIGGAGQDTFVFSDTGSDDIDTIADYVIGEDTIDLSDLLNDDNVNTGNVGSYVRVQDIGTDALLQVDLDGASNGANWVDVATLTGHGTQGTVIDLKIDDEHHTVTIPTI